MQIPPIGKLRGLAASADQNGVFTVLAFDHRQSFVKMIGLDLADPASYPKVVEAKSDVVRALGGHASAVLLDPIYGAAQAIVNRSLPGNAGLMVAIEKSGYTGESAARVTELLPGWTIPKIKRLGADSVKLLIYYHPDAGDLAVQQERLVVEIAEACNDADLAYFLEPVTYSIDPVMDKNSQAFADTRTDVIVRTAENLGGLGADVLKLEFPVDSNLNPDEGFWREACEAVSAASPIPWTLLSAGVDYELFTQQVETACRSGASGFIGGRAIWKEGIPMPSDERRAWLGTVSAQRMAHLRAIAGRYAKPWTDFPIAESSPLDEGWYQHYGG